MVGNIRVTGEQIRWKAEESLHGLTIEDTKASMLTIKSKAREFSTGLMAGNTKDNGTMANSMV